MKIIMLGAPGSGKGTTAKILAKKTNIPHISTGDIFREQIKKETELGKLANSYISQGKLVPDEVTINIVKDRLNWDDTKDGVILDGFPRTIEQARALDEILEEKGKKVDVVPELVVPDQVIVERILNRATCSNKECGAIYNTKFKPSKVEGICDICGSALVTRTDDTEEAIKTRLEVYRQNSKDLIDYYKEKYGKESKFLAYGADIYGDYDESLLAEFGLKAYDYYLLVARLEPENNIVMAVEGYLASKEKGKKPLIIVGKTNTPHGRYLMEKYGNKEGIRFVGGIYDFEKLNSVRYYSFAYFHGHSVGGTNPSLLEAMASSCYILANDNIFNRAVLKKNAEYYKDSEGVKEILNHIERLADRDKVQFIRENLEEIRKEYSWEHLVDEHEAYFNWLLTQKR